MDKEVLVFGFLGVGILTFGFIIFRVGAALSQKALVNMRTLADRLNLQVVEKPKKFGVHPYPEATGTMRRKPVRIYNFTTGTGKSKTTWSALSVTPAVHAGLTFALTHQGFTSKVMELFGTKEVQVGDAAFDREWFIRSSAPDFFAAALLPEIQAKIQTNPGEWKLQDGVILYTERGLFTDTARCDRFVTVAAAACDLADIAEVYAQPAKS
jgi:hypothetical protein